MLCFPKAFPAAKNKIQSHLIWHEVEPFLKKEKDIFFYCPFPLSVPSCLAHWIQSWLTASATVLLLCTREGTEARKLLCFRQQHWCCSVVPEGEPGLRLRELRLAGARLSPLSSTSLAVKCYQDSLGSSPHFGFFSGQSWKISNLMSSETEILLSVWIPVKIPVSVDIWVTFTWTVFPKWCYQFADTSPSSFSFNPWE